MILRHVRDDRQTRVRPSVVNVTVDDEDSPPNASSGHIHNNTGARWGDFNPLFRATWRRSVLGIRAGSARIVCYYSAVRPAGASPDRAVNPLVGLLGPGVETVLEVEVVREHTPGSKFERINSGRRSTGPFDCAVNGA